MIEQIVNLVKNSAGSAITNNKDIPSDKKDYAIESIATGLLDGIKNHSLSEGGLSDIKTLFEKGGKVSGALTKTVQNSVINSLLKKLGLENNIASSIATSIVPLILGKISNTGLDLGNLFGGKGGFSVGNLIEKFSEKKDSKDSNASEDNRLIDMAKNIFGNLLGKK